MGRSIVKAIVIMPCKDEESTIEEVIKGLRKNKIKLEIVGIDDCSGDRTREILKRCADRVICLDEHRTLAQVVKIGLAYAVEKDPDIIIHIDADGQYDPAELRKLLDPILKKRADLVIGERKIKDLAHMPFFKKAGNIFFSKIVSCIIRQEIKDAQSGFRAMRIPVAKAIPIESSYTYTQEEIIKAAQLGFRIAQVPISFRKRESGRSRLIKSTLVYGIRVSLDMLRLLFRRQVISGKANKTKH